jgi:DNA-binding MarR family transcriptional regulator
VTTISDRLCLRHHSTVELIDRLEKQGAVSRQHGEEDRREVLLHLTPRGEDWLRRLTVSIWPQLQVEGVALSDSLKKLLAASKEQGREPR